MADHSSKETTMTDIYTEKAMNLNVGFVGERHVRLREKGILFLDSEIDTNSFCFFVRDLLYSKLCLNTKKALIILNSPGGDVLHGFAIFDVIKAMAKTQLNLQVLGMGMVASMATAIIQAGTKRLVLPNTQFLLHQISTPYFLEKQEVNESEEATEELKRLNGIFLRIIAERAGIDESELFRLTKKKNFWLDAKEAKKFGAYGLIDEIVEEIPFAL